MLGCFRLHKGNIAIAFVLRSNEVFEQVRRIMYIRHMTRVRGGLLICFFQFGLGLMPWCMSLQGAAAGTGS